MVEQFQPTCDGVGRITGLYRMRVSGIHEHQFAGVVARPYGRGQGIEQRAHRLDVAQQLVMAGGEIQQFLLDAAYVAQAQHGTAGDGTSLSFHRASGTRCQRHDKAAAIAAQGIDRLLHAPRGHGLKPGTERKHTFRDAAGCSEGDVAENFRLLGSGGPGHQDLGLRQQQRLEAIGFGLQCDDLVPRAGLEALGGPAGADERHAREQTQAQAAQGRT